MVWHRTRSGDFGLRSAGLALCAVSYLAITTLVGMHVPPQSADLLAYGLAAIGFLCASCGSAMAMLGRHLFDEVEVSPRWRRHRPDRREHPFDHPGDDTVSKVAEPELLVIGKDVDQSWTVREGAGQLIARFPSEKAARGYANTQRRERPLAAIVSSTGFRARIDGRLSLAMARPVGTA